ncbi:zinc finger BED domain-containing protein RICESLEEPER [Trifolium repens]|nr:zinc finger BED domain-containing protein RICESLEEPER [Trifolium repens]
MSDNTLDWTMPPPTADGSIEHESHGDETACLLEEKKRKTRSPMWQHFTAVPGKVKQAQCNYCDTLIMYKDGTSGMRNHLKRCDDYDGNTEVTQPKKRRKINAQGQVVSSPSVCKFDQAACRAQLVRTFVCAELPFRFVENEEFRKLLLILQPRFDIPSRSTLRRDIWELYIEEKEKLKKSLKNCGRVCLTTDTWTSAQNLSYMCLTLHFVDSEWKIHKKIINFCQITGHTGDMIGQYVDGYLKSWGLSKILSITVDNAMANTAMMKYLKTRMRSWDNHVLNVDFMHMRCCTHVLNLIVKSGMKEDKGSSILKIREAVKYVKSSPPRLLAFMKCAADENVSYKGAVVLDVETRWNSTYLMLNVAVKYKNAFDLFYIRDPSFQHEMLLKSADGLQEKDWDYVISVLPLLELFYKSTTRLSGSLYVTSASYMKEVFYIWKGINKHLESDVANIKETAKKMKAKFDKYWGDPKKINILLLIAFVLDPRVKKALAEFYISLLYGKNGDDLKKRLDSSLKKLYSQYSGIDDSSQSSQPATQPNDDDDDIFCHYSKKTGHKDDPTTKTEIESYFQEERVPYNSSIDLDILGWWKANSTRYPILASIAREVLAIPATTVASESAFSTGGRVVGDYRTCLTPKMVEALVCTQDWFKGASISLFSHEDIDEIHRLEQEITCSVSTMDIEDLAS